MEKSVTNCSVVMNEPLPTIATHTQMQEGSMSGSNGHTLCCRVHMASRHLLCWNSQPAPSVGGFILTLLLPSLRWMKKLPQRNSEPSDLLQTDGYHVKIKFIYYRYGCLNLIQDKFRGPGEQMGGLFKWIHRKANVSGPKWVSWHICLTTNMLTHCYKE